MTTGKELTNMSRKTNQYLLLGILLTSLLLQQNTPLSAKAENLIDDSFAIGIACNDILIDNCATCHIVQQPDSNTLDITMQITKEYSTEELQTITGTQNISEYDDTFSIWFDGITWNPDECQVIFYNEQVTPLGTRKTISRDEINPDGTTHTMFRTLTNNLSINDSVGCMITLFETVTDSTTLNVFGRTYTLSALRNAPENPPMPAIPPEEIPAEETAPPLPTENETTAPVITNPPAQAPVQTTAAPATRITNAVTTTVKPTETKQQTVQPPHQNSVTKKTTVQTTATTKTNQPVSAKTTETTIIEEETSETTTSTTTNRPHDTLFIRSTYRQTSTTENTTTTTTKDIILPTDPPDDKNNTGKKGIGQLLIIAATNIAAFAVGNFLKDKPF